MSDPRGSAPAGRPPGGRSGWLVGVLAVVVLAYIAVNTLRTEGPGGRGLAAGTPLPDFAAPLARSSLEGDVNVAQRANSGRAGKVPACSVHGPGVLNSCELTDGRPAVLGFFFTRGAHCEGAFDAMDRLAGTQRRVRFAGVIVREDREAAARIAAEHGWDFPVAYDRDGALANVIGVAVCPELVLLRPGGRVWRTAIGQGVADDLPALVSGLRRAVRAGRAR